MRPRIKDAELVNSTSKRKRFKVVRRNRRRLEAVQQSLKKPITHKESNGRFIYIDASVT